MTLQVIGSGLGRTGTKSLHAALESLGFGPCHHMFQVFANPESMHLWIAAGKAVEAGESADWDAVFDGYVSAVDYPTAAYWRQICDYYPDAKVVHTVRDPEQWFESTQATIFRAGGNADAAMKDDSTAGEFFRSFVRPPLRDHLHDRDFLLDYFRRHTEAVEATIAPERLLVYQVSEGWKPLCDFLGVPVPDEPFPAQNNRQEFIARVGSFRDSGAR